MRSRACLLAATAFWAAWVTSVAAEERPAKARIEKPSRVLETIQHPEPVAPADPQKIEEALARGVDFLISRQNEDGSWGSHFNTKGLNIYAPAPGAHHAFRSGVTALCVMALAELEKDGDNPQIGEAIDRGESWMLAHLPSLRRATPDAIYNTWGHAYAIQAMAVLMNRKTGDEERQRRLKQAIAEQIELLKRYECVDGGWCYYDFDFGTQKPAGSTISFVSATVLVALHAAKEAGAEVPEKIIDRAVESIRRQRKPDFTYLYGEYLKNSPMHPVNRPGGSLGRSQACNLAMRLWGDKGVTEEVMTTWLDRLFSRNEWLSFGRKRPVPHESWFAVAGYFFYYGHYYAAMCIEQLPPDARPQYQDHLAHVLLSLQEKDGSWWDYP
ncbi:MAG: terpene cyclase/mutase family protein, partial [Thermoguttaceae bacterium]|nr:terpene cyclase/mutase family protein [Thermoguttaceae bacterium]